MTKQKNKAEFVKWFGPLLDALRDLGDSGKPQILDATLKSGGGRFHNQVAWARQYLVWEGLLDSSKHGTWRLTPKGIETTISEVEARQIFLKWVAIHQEARKKADQAKVTQNPEIQEESSPEEFASEQEIDLLDVLRGLSPLGFEKVCRELLRESGFENVEITGGTADGGIDGYGTLEINPFVSFKVLFQCKRYAANNTVSRAQVGDFRNAMLGRAEKGIIITTSSFSNSARLESCREGAPPIELVDGKKLVEMFEKVELGVKKKTVYSVDISYFENYK
jgi:restriction system protein